MKPLSATDAAVLAIGRSYHFLCRPFAWAEFLKLGLAGVLTEGTLVSFRFVAHDFFASDSVGLNWLSARVEWLRSYFTGDYLPLGLVACVAALVLVLLLLSLGTHLRFAFFRCLLNQNRRIREAWAISRVPADRFFVASLLVWVSFLGLVLLFVVTVGVLVFVLFTARTPEGKLDAGVFLLLFFPCVGFAVSIVTAAVLAEVVMHDFVLPHMAIEQATFHDAWVAVWRAIVREKESFFSYLLLRVGGTVFAGAVLGFAAWLVGVPGFAMLERSVAGYNALLDDAAWITAWTATWLASALDVLFAVLTFSLGVVLAAAFGGPLGIFIRCFAIFFYGSRYKALGELLEASQAEPIVPLQSMKAYRA